MDIMTATKAEYKKEFKKKVLAGNKIFLVDVMNCLCPGRWRVEIYTKESEPNGPSSGYRGFFKFSSEDWPPTSPHAEGEPELEVNDRDCGIVVDLYGKVKIVDDYLIYKSKNPYNSSEKIFKLYFVEDKPLPLNKWVSNI